MTRISPWLCFTLLAGCQPADDGSLVRDDAAPPTLTQAPADCLFSQQVNRRTLPAVCLDESPRLADRIGLVNDTDGVVKIKGIGRSCVCSEPHVTEKVVPPGGRTEVTADIGLPRASGPWTYTLTMDLDGRGPCQVTTAAYLYRTLESDKEVVNLTGLKPGEVHHSVLKIITHRRRDDPVRSIEVRSGNGRMAVARQGSISAEVHGIIREVQDVELGLTAGSAGETAEDTLVVALSGANPPTTLTVRVAWGAATPFTIIPARAFLNLRPKANKPVSQTLVVQCQAGEFTPTVHSADLPAGLTVTFRPTAVPANWLADVTADPVKLAPESRRLDIPVATGRSDEPTFLLPVTLFRD